MGFSIGTTKIGDLEWRNGCVFCVILPNSVTFVANYLKVVG